MKVVAALCLIFIAASSAKTLDPSFTNNVLKTIVSLREVSNNIRKDIVDVPGELEQRKNKITFGIPEDTNIIAIQERLKSKSSSKNAIRCDQLFRERLQHLNEKLQNKLSREVDTQLRNNALSLDFIEKILSDLEKELSECAINDKCKTAEDYETELDHSKKVLDNINNITHLSIDYIMILKLSPIVGTEIDTIVYTPVTKCLRDL